jgi:hypothetical protein
MPGTMRSPAADNRCLPSLDSFAIYQQFQIDWRVMFSPTISMCVGGLGRDQLDGWVKVVVSRRL